MNDDRLLRDLARAAEEERALARLDERWDRLAAGELSTAQEAELQALAAGSEEDRLAYEAFRPLGPGFEARIVESIQAQAGATAAREAPKPARVLPFRRWSPWLGGSLVAAAAACLALFLSAPAQLPPYSLEVAGGDQAERGVTAGFTTVRVLHPGSALAVTLRPQTGVSGRVEARWFAARGATVRALAARQEVSRDGAVRLSGTLGEDLAIEPGDWTLWVVVGRPGKLPGTAVLGAHPAAQVLRGAGWTASRDRMPLKVEVGR